MPTKHKRLSHTDSQARDLEIVRLKLSGMTTTQMACRFKLTGGRSRIRPPALSTRDAGRPAIF